MKQQYTACGAWRASPAPAGDRVRAAQQQPEPPPRQAPSPALDVKPGLNFGTQAPRYPGFTHTRNKSFRTRPSASCLCCVCFACRRRPSPNPLLPVLAINWLHLPACPWLYPCAHCHFFLPRPPSSGFSVPRLPPSSTGGCPCRGLCPAVWPVNPIHLNLSTSSSPCTISLHHRLARSALDVQHWVRCSKAC